MQSNEKSIPVWANVVSPRLILKYLYATPEELKDKVTEFVVLNDEIPKNLKGVPHRYNFFFHF